MQHPFCTFLGRCFARLQRETSGNFLVTRFMEEMSYVFLFTFFSLPLIFALIGHFGVMDGSESGVDLVLIQTFLFYYVNQVILMLTSIFQGQFP